MDERSIAVLLIQDDVKAVQRFRQALAGVPSPHFVISSVAGLNSALGRLAEEHFDVIALDLDLPHEQGPESLVCIQAGAPQMPIVALTGEAGETLGLDAVRWGAQDYLVKGQFDGGLLARVLCCAIERRRVGEALRKSEERWRTYADTANDWMCTLDPAGTITWANQAVYAATGYEEDELVGRNVLHMIAPESYVAAAAALHKVLNQQDVEEAILDAMSKDGRRLTIEIRGRMLYEHGQFAGTFHIAREVTQRKQIEDALRESENRLRVILDSVQTGVMILNPESHTIVDVNPAGASMIGAPREAIIGALCHKFFCPAEVGRCPITDLGLAVDRAERSLLTADGTERPIIKTVGHIILNGRPHLLESFTDISERKQAEAQLQDSLREKEMLLQEIHLHARRLETLNRQVEQRAAELEERNAELDTFASMVAHDLRDPLGIIAGFADLLEEGWTDMDSAQIRRSLEVISNTSARMSRIVHDLLLLARVRKQDVQPVALDMGHIVADTCERLGHLIEKCQAKISLPDTWPVALGHAPWIEEVWANYLSNALKYGGSSPRIELGATAQPEDGSIRFWVYDYGPGIAPEDRSRLFVPFTRLSQVRAAGHGLGLSIVRLIVEKLHGQVGVESTGLPGQGSVFSFTLPAAAPAGPSLKDSPLAVSADPIS